MICPVLITGVHDGDTCSGTVDLGFHVSFATSFRLNGINAPELATPKGPAARAALAAMLPIGAKVQAKVYGQEKFGRWLADFFVTGGMASELMIAQGQAVAWDGKGPRP